MKTSLVSAKFINDVSLFNAYIKVIESACKELTLISPYIKLNTRFKNALNELKTRPKTEVYLVFGKNKDNKSKSLSKEDLHFFCELPNIQILYNENLHAKYISNERYQILSSMNLYDFSINENHEAGFILDKSSVLDTIDDKVYFETADYFTKIIEKSRIIYDKIPVIKKSFLKTTIVEDEYEIIADFRQQFFKGNLSQESLKTGYCISTGKKISFNIKKPYSRDAYKQWLSNSDKNQSENYCHYSGEKSNGKTSFKYPVLRKYWDKAKEMNA